MSYIEASFIKKQEYDNLRDSRLLESQLVIDELYSAMFALAANSLGRQAAKLPLRLHSLTKNEAGVCIASVALLDRDLANPREKTAVFSNGYWTNAKDQVNIVAPHISRSPVMKPTEGYLSSYNDPFYNELAALSTSLVLPKELVLV